ncbi:MAG: glycoside hydrolase [Verrucomicrobiota bacterium]|nr:glycoside hydrolase [Verrucomicrobiota bacterium]
MRLDETVRFLALRGALSFSWVLDELADARNERFDGSHFLTQADGSRWMSWLTGAQKLAQLCPRRASLARAPHLSEWLTASDGCHFDTTAMTGLVECFHPEHPCTRAQDREARVECLQRFLQEGQIISSEAGQDWAVPFADILSTNNFGHHVVNTRTGWRPLPFPLFSLVYRECVGSVWHEGDTYHDGCGMEKLLYDAAFGNAPTLSPLLRNFSLQDGKPDSDKYDLFFRDETTGMGWQMCLRAGELARFHADTWKEELRQFEYLDSSCLLSRSEFSGGAAVLVNRSTEQALISGCDLPPQSYRIIR